MTCHGEEVRRVHRGYDLLSQERDQLIMLLKKTQEKSESENSPEFICKVRGPTVALKIVNLSHK